MMRIREFKLALILVSFLSVATIYKSFAADIEGSSDHPMVSRYERSEIKDYDFREFDQYVLLLGKVAPAPGEPNNLKVEKSETLEGKVTKISYYLPEDRSTLEVFRNYENALKDAGFDILYTCSDKECGGRDFNHEVVEYNSMFGDNYYDQRYLTAKLARSDGDINV